MDIVNEIPVDDHIPFLIDAAHRRMQQDLARIVGEHRFTGLRGSHLRLIGMVPADGARPSALAAIASVTRPALGELVAHLQEHGYATTREDPSDRRAIIVTLTAEGRRAAKVVARAVAQLRSDWADEVGADRVDALVQTLAALTVSRPEPS